MDDGIMLIEHYSDQFKLFEQQRVEFGKFVIYRTIIHLQQNLHQKATLSINLEFLLVNAEKLFDMEFTDYANFLQAKKEFDGIIRILRLYEKQKVAITSWATTIWTNLKPNLLLEAIEDNIQDFRQLEEWVSRSTEHSA